jgi:L-rhamnose mutarotase
VPVTDNGPQRAAFTLSVRPDRIDDYVAAHAAVWPEMLAALRAAGFRNYTIFRNGTQVFGYFEADDVAAALDAMAASPINTVWQDRMADLLERRVDDAGPALLPEVFRLD